MTTLELIIFALSHLEALTPDAAVFSTALLACERLGSFEKAWTSYVISVIL